MSDPRNDEAAVAEAIAAAQAAEQLAREEHQGEQRRGKHGSVPLEGRTLRALTLVPTSSVGHGDQACVWQSSRGNLREKLGRSPLSESGFPRSGPSGEEVPEADERGERGRTRTFLSIQLEGGVLNRSRSSTSVERLYEGRPGP